MKMKIAHHKAAEMCIHNFSFSFSIFNFHGNRLCRECAGTMGKGIVDPIKKEISGLFRNNKVRERASRKWKTIVTSWSWNKFNYTYFRIISTLINNLPECLVKHSSSFFSLLLLGARFKEKNLSLIFFEWREKILRMTHIGVKDWGGWYSLICHWTTRRLNWKWKPTFLIPLFSRFSLNWWFSITFTD